MTFSYQQRLPAEWEPQAALLITWPHEDTDWQLCLDDIHKGYIELVTAVTPFQAVLILFHNQALADKVLAELQSHQIDMQNVFTCIAPNNDTWIRDYGPLTVQDQTGNFILLDCEFNAWGSKYDSQLDNQVTRNLMQSEHTWLATHQTVDFVIEGGSIDVNGTGALITTAKCLLNPSRNPDMSQAQIETKLKELLGVTQVHWLFHGYLQGDDTDAHIDTLVRFIRPDTLAYTTCTDQTDSHYIPLIKMHEELKQLKQANGQPYKLVPLPLPNSAFDPITKNRLPATYANFIFVNGAVILPTYDCKEDKLAIQSLSTALPELKIVGVHANAFIRQYGSLHCSCMQIPYGALQLTCR